MISVPRPVDAARAGATVAAPGNAAVETARGDGAVETAAVGTAPDDAAARAARWQDLQHALFGARKVEDGSAWIAIDAPGRALDAALVPVGLTLAGDRPVKGIYLVIDENPGPLAGHFTFGPQADPRSLKLRVRVNAYTNIHAVVETSDDHLYSAVRFVKAAGGCSAPAGGDLRQAMQELGHIKVRLLDPFVDGKPLAARLMIRHPNFNGMQMDQLTRLYTPAMFIRTIDVSYNGSRVLHLDSDISLSADPVIEFGFIPAGKGQLQVLVRDTKDATFGQSFDVPPKG
jgi:sulfur-oxidizing protein SoxY